jgi:hypothetical protein
MKNVTIQHLRVLGGPSGNYFVRQLGIRKGYPYFILMSEKFELYGWIHNNSWFKPNPGDIRNVCTTPEEHRYDLCFVSSERA